MPHPLLQPVTDALDGLRGATLSPAEASARLRDQSELIGALPPRFGEVLGQLLDRLESSALFDGESCSFSSRDLHDSLQFWIDKAEAQLAPA